MGRWEPNARQRLEQAALELYSTRGFDQTTVADIAARSGLTERTYFRHFIDKREVLFGGEGSLQKLLVKHVTEAPSTLASLDAVAAALEVAETFFVDRQYSRRRQRVIATNPVLRERELMKMASLSEALAVALRARGVKELAAKLAADSGMAIFKIAYERWLDETNKREFQQHIRDALAELRAVTAER